MIGLIAFTNFIQIRMIEKEYGLCRYRDRKGVEDILMRVCRSKDHCGRVRIILDKNEEKIKSIINNKREIDNDLLDFVINELELMDVGTLSGSPD